MTVKTVDSVSTKNSCSLPCVPSFPNGWMPMQECNLEANLSSKAEEKEWFLIPCLLKYEVFLCLDWDVVITCPCHLP